MMRKAIAVTGVVVAMGVLSGCAGGSGDLESRLRDLDGVEDAKVKVVHPGAPWNRAGQVVVQVDDDAAELDDLMIQALVLTAHEFPDESQSIVVSFTTDDTVEITRSSTPLVGFEDLVSGLPFSEARAITDTAVSANPAKVIAWAEANGYSVE